MIHIVRMNCNSEYLTLLNHKLTNCGRNMQNMLACLQGQTHLKYNQKL